MSIVRNQKTGVQDAVTGAEISISYAHHEVHGGSSFFHREAHAIARAGILNHLIVTPDTTKFTHLIIGVQTITSSIMVELFEDTVTSNDGTPLAIINRNRNSSNSNTTLVFVAPTITDDGTELSSGDFGAGRNSSGGGARDSEEIILKRNTKYLLRVTEDDIEATTINIDFNWYEHTNKN